MTVFDAAAPRGTMAGVAATWPRSRREHDVLMAADTITIHLPDPLYHRLERLATLTRQPLEGLIVTTLASNLPPLPDDLPPAIRDALLALEVLGDDELRHRTRATLPDEEYARLADLREGRRDGALSSEEQAELDRLLQAGDLLTLQKAYAAVLLKWRGRRLPARCRGRISRPSCACRCAPMRAPDAAIVTLPKPSSACRWTSSTSRRKRWVVMPFEITSGWPARAATISREIARRLATPLRASVSHCSTPVFSSGANTSPGRSTAPIFTVRRRSGGPLSRHCASTMASSSSLAHSGRRRVVGRRTRTLSTQTPADDAADLLRPSRIGTSRTRILGRRSGSEAPLLSRN